MAETRRLTMQQALSQAEQAAKKGDVDFAKQLYGAVLQKHPDHLLAKKSLRKLERDSQPNQTRPTAQTDPPPDQMNTLLSLYNSGEMRKAEQACKKMLAIFPKAATVYSLLGATLYEQGKVEQALKIYDRAIQLKPDYAEAYNNRSIALGRLGQLEDAIKSYDKAIQLKPDYAEAHYNCGIVLKDLGQLEEAIKSYDRAIQCKPDYAQAYNNRGIALKKFGKLEDALNSYGKAIQLKPDYAQAYYNRGTFLKDLGQLEDAIKNYDKAIQISPKYYSARLNRSLAWLLVGNFQQGWPEYEFRFKPLKQRKPTFQQGAEWQAEPLENKKVFVYPEQGFGDIIQFIRYLPMIKELGGKVIFQVTKPLLRLMETFQGYDQLWSEQHNLDASSKNNFDYHVPLLSLPGLFNTTLENIPSASPYLSADNKLIRMWQKRIASNELFKVGIVWAGSNTHKGDHIRSIRLSDFKVLSDIKGIKLFSLQKEKYAKWTDIDPGEVVDIDLGAEVLDFADTAAIIENLDLVVSVDTSVAHLAGALGKEVWTLLPFSPDWRWMLNRSDSPWYPTMRLFRQPSVCDWKSVLQEVRKALVQRSAVMGNKVVP